MTFMKPAYNPNALLNAFTGLLESENTLTANAQTASSSPSTGTGNWTFVQPQNTESTPGFIPEQASPGLDFNNPWQMFERLDPETKKAVGPGIFSAAVTGFYGNKETERADARAREERTLIMTLANKSLEERKEAADRMIPANKEMAMIKGIFSPRPSIPIVQVPVTLAPYQNSLYRVRPGVGMNGATTV
jgi:hypothetical protein